MDWECLSVPQISGRVVDNYAVAEGRTLERNLVHPAYIALGVLVYFILFFREKRANTGGWFDRGEITGTGSGVKCTGYRLPGTGNRNCNETIYLTTN